MIFDYLVKHNGKYYEPGEDVPIEDTDEQVEEQTEEQADEAVDAEPLPFPDAKTYTKSEISRMTTTELQDLADSVGIENARETSGSKLKEKLIEYYGL